MKVFVLMSLLNLFSAAAEIPAPELAEKMRLQALLLKSKYHTAQTGFRYQELKTSPEYQKLKELSANLKSIDIKQLKTVNDKKAFWINIYNALVVHGIAEKGNLNTKTVWDIPNFFESTAYQIAGHNLNLNEIENGILRANRRRPYRLFKLFSGHDPRLKLALTENEFDPRIHFALNCGSASCPPVSFYKSEQLDDQLELATSGFVQSETKLDKDTIMTSQIFNWYAGDFKPSVREFLLKYTEDEVAKALQNPKVKIKFREYDWSLH